MSGRPRILACRLDNMGDVLLTGPAVRAVAERAEVTMLAGPGGVAAARLLPGVRSVVCFDAPWVAFDPAPVDAGAVEQLVSAVRLGRFDGAVIFTSFHQSPLPLALLLRLAGVSDIAATCVDYPGALLDLRHPELEGVHEVEQHLSLVEAAGFPLAVGDDRRLAVDPDQVRTPPAPPENPYVVIHPGASVPARSLPPGLLDAVVPAVLASGRGVVLTGGAGEQAAARRFAPMPGVTDLTGRLELGELAGVLAGAVALVSGNTGPAHLAAAVGTPVVSVFAPTVPVERWRPWAVPAVLLGDLSVPCAGCRARTCPVPGQPCVGTVTAEQVLDALVALAPAGDRTAA
jgi:heptosyltransferase III